MQFVRNGILRANGKRLFPTFFFFFPLPLLPPLNELFFIRRQRYAISPPLSLSSSLTSILSRTFSSLSLSFLFYYFSFSRFRPFDSSSATYHPRLVSRVLLSFIFLHAVLPFVVSSSPSPLNSIVRFFSFFRDRVFILPNSVLGRFSPWQFYCIFTLTLTRSLPLPLLHEFFSPRFYEFSDHFFPSSSPLSVQRSILVLRFKR